MNVKELGFDAKGNRIIEVDGIAMVVDKEKGKAFKYDPEKAANEERAKKLVGNFDSVNYSYTATDKNTGKHTVVRVMTKKAVRGIGDGTKAIGAIEYKDGQGATKKAITQWYISKTAGEWRLNGASGAINGLDDKDLDTLLDVQRDIGWIE